MFSKLWGMDYGRCCAIVSQGKSGMCCMFLTPNQTKHEHQLKWHQSIIMNDVEFSFASILYTYQLTGLTQRPGDGGPQGPGQRPCYQMRGKINLQRK